MARALGGAVETARGPRWVPLAEVEAAVADGAGRIIAIGGDGTVTAVASAMAAAATPAPIGIVPAGTGNNLARGLGVPLDPRRAFALALSATHTRKIDAIRYSAGAANPARFALQTTALGFAADVAGRYDALREGAVFRAIARPFGQQIYRVLAVLGMRDQIRRERRGDLGQIRLRFPGEEFAETVFAIFIGNERSLGGDFFPCPEAKIDDGLIDVCIVRAGTGRSYLKLLKSVTRGEHLAFTDAVVYRQTAGPIEIELDRPHRLLADGDLWEESDRYRLEVLPSVVEFLIGDDALLHHNGPSE